MVNRGSRKIRCFQCGVPLVHRGITYEVEGRKEVFCCTGCYVVLRITGSKGEEGLAQALLGRLGLGLLLSMNVLLLSAIFYGSIYASIKVPEGLATPVKFLILTFSTPVMILLGYPILKASINSLRQGRITIELLIIFGAFSAFAMSVYSTFTGKEHIYYETATMVLTLFTMGRYIEARSRVKTYESLRNFFTSMPDRANILFEDGRIEAIPLDKIGPGDIVIVREGERIPVDGIIVEGSGEIDESLIKGESIPATCRKGDRVFAGSVNLTGNVVIRTTEKREDFLVAKIERLIDELKDNPSPTKRIADKIATLFVPVVVSLSLGILIYWTLMGDISTGIFRMLTVALISCPCAFGLAAPLAVWKGLQQGLKKGIVIKGGDTLEFLSKIRTIFFDKTGTLTTGKFRLQEIRCNGISEDEAMKIAISLEQLSPHPLAKAIVSSGKERGIIPSKVEDFRSFPGYGVSGIVKGRRYYLGNKKWMEARGIHINGENDNGLYIYLMGENVLLATFILQQEIRPGTGPVLDMLKKMGIKTVVLTGDSLHGVRSIEEYIKPDQIRSGLLPQDKVNIIKKESGVTAMVGDGINDAPAMKAATMGISMGSGADITKDVARVSLLRDDVSLIPYLIHLSRQVKRKIYSNFLWAFSYNGVGMYLAIKGTITPLFAVVAMLVSSLLVIANSLRS